MMEHFKAILLPVVSIIVLVIGNLYQGLTQDELNTISNALLALGTAILGVLSAYGVVKKKKEQPKD